MKIIKLFENFTNLGDIRDLFTDFEDDENYSVNIEECEIEVIHLNKDFKFKKINKEKLFKENNVKISKENGIVVTVKSNHTKKGFSKCINDTIIENYEFINNYLKRELKMEINYFIVMSYGFTWICTNSLSFFKENKAYAKTAILKAIISKIK